jgi:stearoyl-CoA desaturase (Delta-9 desaturase)
MPPAPHTSNGPLVAMPEGDSEPRLPSKEELKKQEEAQLYEEFSGDIVWFNTIGFVILHVLCLIGGIRCAGTILFIHYVVQWKTIFWGQFFLAFFLMVFQRIYFSAFIVGLLSAQGVLMGAHRLYSHKSYKASKALKALLLFWQTVAGQVSGIFHS